MNSTVCILAESLAEIPTTVTTDPQLDSAPNGESGRWTPKRRWRCNLIHLIICTSLGLESGSQLASTVKNIAGGLNEIERAKLFRTFYLKKAKGSYLCETYSNFKIQN